MDKVTLTKLDETWIHVDCDDRSAHVALNEHLSFYVDGAHHQPAVKAGRWDGYHRLYNSTHQILPKGLLHEVGVALDGYPISYEGFEPKVNVTDDVLKYLKSDSVNLPFKPRPYQLKAVVTALSNRNCVLEAATNSGKSFMVYMMFRYLQTQTTNKMLLLVPTVGLVEQMYSDFDEYAENDEWDVADNVHKISAGADKYTDKQIVISTWQSLYKLDSEYFEQFDVVVADECHLATSNSIKHIVQSSVNAFIKLGMTGTLDDMKMAEMMLTGLFGKIYNIITAKQLIDMGYASKLTLRFVEFHYNESLKKEFRRGHKKYPDEIKKLLKTPERVAGIVELVAELPADHNTAVLFRYEYHGKELYAAMQARFPDRFVYFQNGGVKAKDRERIRKAIQAGKGCIMVASEKTFALGTNIVRLNTIVIGTPMKSKITTIQALGRVLRKGDGKYEALLLDIVDDLRVGSYVNYAYKHGIARYDHYRKEGHAVTSAKKMIDSKPKNVKLAL